ncbi:sensor histidine kinase [Marinimicrobium alkaliphilum]|uniref:sensor histidine kinase n=1 Tax=Marinimicrobium alkaliphilum TaxID=2202654 RepID=UPI000DB9FBF0|nr:ATP-binding protein [Marinimicrobium alkaliphilum]
MSGVSAARTVEAPVDERQRDLQSAFEMFNDISEQLMSSYQLLENRVAELNQELTSVTRQRMEELAEKERLACRLENLLNFLPGGVIVLDPAGRVSECNPSAIDLLGEPLRGAVWRDVIARSFAPRQDDGHEVSLHDGRRISIATRNLEDDGQIILLTDQTETRRLQSELSRHERLSAMGQMMSALAHQIRTPLSAAMLYAGHLCGDQLDPPKRAQFADKVLNRLTNIERQVQDMLLFVKGELPLNDTLSVAELQLALEEAMEAPLMTSESICHWQNDSRKEYLHCNREALVGALMNLVNNAIQAVGQGAVLHLSFVAERLAGQPWLIISLRDEGPGIDAKLLPNVEEVFVTTKSQGTGLGLMVVQAVARAHGGRFLLESKPGFGTTGRVLIPLIQTDSNLCGGR